MSHPFWSLGFFDEGLLDVDFQSEATYSPYIHAEVTDAYIEAQQDHIDSDGEIEIEDFLGRLWNRGFKVVPILKED